MAILRVKSPNGTTQSFNISTMNVSYRHAEKGYILLPTNLLFQWGKDGNWSLEGSEYLSIKTRLGIMTSISTNQGTTTAKHYYYIIQGSPFSTDDFNNPGNTKEGMRISAGGFTDTVFSIYTQYIFTIGIPS